MITAQRHGDYGACNQGQNNLQPGSGQGSGPGPGVVHMVLYSVIWCYMLAWCYMVFVIKAMSTAGAAGFIGAIWLAA
jgi:hypothetical protein